MLIATTNPGKVREITRALAHLPMEFRTLADLAAIPEPEETGRSFAENALLKANYYARSSLLQTVAEDSGLVIDALGGRPGVESARYPGATYADKFAGLYRELARVPRPWTARFVCSLACVGVPGPNGSPVLFTCEGVVQGEIAPSPKGSGGFGYDPIFYYPPYDRTLGEVSDDLKLAVSHRGQAFRMFAEWLSTGEGRP